MMIVRLFKSTALRALFLTTLATASCTFANAQKVSTDYDHRANFGAFHTFSIYKLQASSTLFEQRLRDDLIRTLTSRGLQMVPEGGDLAIAAIGSRKNQQEYNSFYEGLGGGGFGWRGRGFGGFGGGFGDEGVTNTQLINIPVGTLVIDMYDGPKHQLVFRGMASETLSGNEDKNSKKLEKSVEKILEKYPSKQAR
jgi:hypothetical protein